MRDVIGEAEPLNVITESDADWEFHLDLDSEEAVLLYPGDRRDPVLFAARNWVGEIFTFQHDFHDFVNLRKR